MKTVLGIDEAGRGAVIGPLVICGAMFDENDLQKLKELHVRDSKLMTPHQRENVAPEIQKIAKKLLVFTIEAHEIDDYRANGVDLNKLEAIKMAEIIRLLEPDVAYVDAPQVSTGKFRMFLEKLAKNHTEIIAENYADKKYVAVSAASVIAKVIRDAHIENIKHEYGHDFGVGYSHDERTRGFLKKLLKDGGYPKIVRKSWSTSETIKRDHEQARLHKFKKKDKTE